MLAVTHQAQYFDIVISITNPYSIRFDLIKPIYPSIKSNPDMLVAIAKEIAGYYLSSDELVLVILLQRLLICLRIRCDILDGWS